MRRFECGNDSLGAREQARSVKRSLIRDGGILSSALIREPRMFGPDGGIVESCGNGMGGGDLPVFVLQNVSVCSLEHARPRSREPLMRRKSSGVLAKLAAAASCFNPNQLHFCVLQELVKKSNRIRAAANACEKMRGQALFRGQDLLARF